MGMFDYVDFECDCPKCGKKVNGFQSKDRDCQLHNLQINEVDEFYSQCDGCNTWVEFHRMDKRGIPIRLTDEEKAIEFKNFKLRDNNFGE